MNVCALVAFQINKHYCTVMYVDYGESIALCVCLSAVFDRPSTQTPPACQYTRTHTFVWVFHHVSTSVGGEEGKKSSDTERDKRSKVMLVLVSYPASCASCALMTDSKLLVCKNSHTAG